MVIKPIEDFVFEGLVERMQQTFNCICIVTTANDKTKQLARLREGGKVDYPYIFIVINSWAHNKESYSSNMMARRGLITVVGEEQAMTVRLIPTNFEIEVEFITNKYQGIDGSVMAFAKRWMFAQRCGYLKFNTMYGRLQLSISMTMSETVNTPPLDNKTEAESSYKSSSTMTVHGFVSEAVLGTQGIVNTLVVDEVVTNSDGSVDGYQFIPF